MSPSIRPLPIFLLFSLITACLGDIVTLRRDRRGTAAALSSVNQVEDLHFLPPAGTNPGDAEDDHLELLDIVLLASVDGKFHALNRATGEHLWSMPSTTSFTSTELQSDAARTVLSTLQPLVSTQHSDYNNDLDDDTYPQETYIIEPQSGDIYVTSSPAEPLQRLPFSMPQLVDMSPFSFGDSDRRVFVGRKKTSLLLLELETGRVKAALDSECPWDPFEDLTTRDPMDGDVDLDELDGTKPPKPQYPKEIFIGRADYHISIHTRPLSPSSKRPPVQNLSFSTYGPNNQDLQHQAAYRRTVDDTYVEPLPNGEVIAFKTRGVDEQEEGFTQNTFVWGQRFAHPIVAVFDVVKNPGRAHPFVLLQPRPRLQDIIPDIELRTGSKSRSRPNPESAYVGLVEETGSLFAMSPDHFPLVVFGGGENRHRKAIDPPPGAVEGAASTPGKYFDLDKACREGSRDRRCSVGIRDLRADSRSRLARLLDGAPADALPLPPNLNSNSQTPSTGERDAGAVHSGNYTFISSWPWSAVGHQSGQIGDAPFVQSTSVLALAISCIIVLGTFLVRRWSRKSPVVSPVAQEKLSNGEMSLENPPAEPAAPAANGAAVSSTPDTPPISDAVSASADAKTPSDRPVEPPEPPDEAGDDETDKEGDNANAGGKRKNQRRRRGKKRGKGVKDNAAEEEAEEKLPVANGDAQEVAAPATPISSPSMLVVPPTPTPATAPSLIVSDTILGFGSHGTVVYEGSLQGRAVAVKRLLQDFVTLAAREVSLLQDADDHPNVIRYYYQESQGNFLYIALELCPASLADIIERPDQHRDIAVSFDPKRALRQITSGLRHLHALKIVHRDIKPQNILVSSAKKGVGESAGHRMLISDFGLCRKLDVDQTSFLPTANGMMGVGTVGWRAPEILKGEVKLDETTGDDNSQSSRDSVGTATGGSSGSTMRPTRLTKSVDIFALGCLFYYTLTNGGHPYGDRYEREANILKNARMLDGLEQFGEEGSEAVDLIGRMLAPEASERPDTTTCLMHPYFWDPGRRLSFLQDASDRFEFMCRDPKEPELLSLEEGAINVVGPDWPSRLDKIFVENLGKFRKYDGRSVQDLLRALRNKKHHYQDLPENVKRHVGSMPEGYLQYFTRRFPRLFLHVHSVVSTTSLRQESMFRSYFNFPD
ncbi:kinase-like protein [Dentipellis sp. KUC8613]|nr:kinase-like protein [Dentipellis sp. KUC8613]